MNNIRRPTQFLHRLEHAACKENCTLAIVFIFVSVLVYSHLAVGEIIIIINEINLYARLRNRCHLNNQRMIGVVDDEIHA